VGECDVILGSEIDPVPDDLVGLLDDLKEGPKP
jgi:hypothetical protein